MLKTMSPEYREAKAARAHRPEWQRKEGCTERELSRCAQGCPQTSSEVMITAHSVRSLPLGWRNDHPKELEGVMPGGHAVPATAPVSHKSAKPSYFRNIT